MPVKPWFPTFVYQSALQGKGKEEFTRAVLEDCQRVREQDVEGRAWCRENYPAGYTSYGSQRKLHRASATFKRLEQKIWRHVLRFTRQIDMDLREAQLDMTDCWVNVMSREAVHPMHLHPGAVISGTFYARTPEGCSGLRFEDPRLEKFQSAPPTRLDARPANQRRVTYDVAAGNLVLFESWLRHEVASNPTADERVSVSFNYAWV
jgi:uncharacterized protein (TIGR02466 family)